jgi:hypothetical protein
MIIQYIISSIITKIRRRDTPETDILTPEQPRTSNGQFAGQPFDLNWARELRRGGASIRQIARQLGVPKSTVAVKLAEPEPAAAITVESRQEHAGRTQAEPESVRAFQVNLRQPSPAAIATAATPATVPADIPATPPAPVPEPKWWNELPPERRTHLRLEAESYNAIFLTDCEYDCLRCWGYAQPAIAIDGWYDGYLKHPAFEKTERFWVHSRNLNFLKAIQASPIRSKCVVLPMGIVDAAQWRLEIHRKGCDDGFFEKCLDCRKPGLRAIPAPPAPIDDLVAAPEPNPEPLTDLGYQPSWMLGGSTASR